MTCICAGNNGLRSLSDRFVCPTCNKRLESFDVIRRLISRVEEMEEDQFKMIGALQVLGADKCDQCGEWQKDCFAMFDRCRCAHCLEGNPEGILSQDDDLETAERLNIGVTRYLAGRNLRIPKNLKEIYKRISA